MKNICVIGADGVLGRELMKHDNTVAMPWMFENDHNIIDEWLEDRPEIDTIWHVARSCRKKGVRRDHDTFLAEHNGMLNLMKSKARHCRFVYASSKIVYGIDGFNCCATECSHEYEPLSVDKVAEYFYDAQVGTFNCPDWQTTSHLDLSSLNNQRTIYALTKLSNEQMIRKYCGNHKIIRIWDIK